jgi:hypothetical protein
VDARVILAVAALSAAMHTAGAAVAETKAEKSSSKLEDREVVIEMECDVRVVDCVCVDVDAGLEVVAAAQGSSIIGAACTPGAAEAETCTEGGGVSPPLPSCS